MKTPLKYIIISFFIIFLYNDTLANNTLKKNDLEVRFFKDKIDIKPGKSFFNILYIKNRSDETAEFNVQFNVPKGWEIIGTAYERYSLPAHGSINLPVRIAVSNNAKGGVGYVVVATITDIKGSALATEYSFLNIPIKSDINVKTSKKSLYFDHKNLSSSFILKLKNTGNIDEIVNVKLVPENSLSVNESVEEILVDDIEVPVNKTKEILYKIKLKNDIDIQKYQYHKVNISINSVDTVMYRSIWFQYLNWKFENNFSNTEKPLNIEATAYNLFNNTKALYRLRVYGKILLKNKRNIRYSFENIKRDQNSNSLWINSRIFTEFKTPKTSLYLGDNIRNYELNMYGRGITIAQKIKKTSIISAGYSERLTLDISKYGGSFYHKFNIPLSFEVGGAYADKRNESSNTYLGFGSFFTKLTKYAAFSLMYANSQSNYQIENENFTYNGWALRSNMSGNIKKLKFRVLGDYGSSHYSGYSKGRLMINGTASQPIFQNGNLLMRYQKQEYSPLYLINNEYRSDKFTKIQSLNLVYNLQIFDKTRLFIGPNIQQKSTNSFYPYSTSGAFSTYTAKGEAGIMLFQKYSDSFLKFSGKYGVTNIYQYVETNLYDASRANYMFNTAELTLAMKKKYFSLNVIYYHGPYSISQEFVYFYSEFFTRSLNILPSYQRYIYKDKLKVTLRGSYIYNIATKNNRIYLNTSLNWYGNKGWSFRFLNTTSYQKITYNSNISSFATTYFEFGIRKTFDINQPRLKYYDFEAVYYKDLNGNRIHDANEPGVPQVLSDINRKYPEQDTQDPNYNGEFIRNELLSNQTGNIRYMNMPEGSYKIKYAPQNTNLGTFETESVEKEFLITRDTVLHIPFLERNKLFGKVTLNRTKHSALGEIPIDNIKITVEGNDKTYSALTDKEGYFELFIPVADYYKVRISNIFREHFELRQEYYIVKFNGYKRFELSFDFDEKERTIAFDESDFLVDDDDVADGDFSFDDIKVIKQTNLKGVIKDANSLIPMHSTVSVFNNKGELISETASSNRTGVYFTSFFAGDNYFLKIYSKGYWVYRENLNIQQVTTFENLNVDIMMKKINIDEEIKSDKFRFKSESAELSPLVKAELDDILSLIFLNSSIHIEISGHTDNIETLLVSADQLSKARAGAVAAYLVKNGLNETRIKIVAKGNSDPKSRIDSENGRKRNRRVDIRVAGF